MEDRFLGEQLGLLCCDARHGEPHCLASCSTQRYESYDDPLSRSHLTLEQIEGIYSQYDRDGTGLLSPTEIEEGLQRDGLSGLWDSHRGELPHYAIDSEGRLSLEAFTMWVSLWDACPVEPAMTRKRSQDVSPRTRGRSPSSSRSRESSPRTPGHRSPSPARPASATNSDAQFLTVPDVHVSSEWGRQATLKGQHCAAEVPLLEPVVAGDGSMVPQIVLFPPEPEPEPDDDASIAGLTSSSDTCHAGETSTEDSSGSLLATEENAAGNTHATPAVHRQPLRDARAAAQPKKARGKQPTGSPAPRSSAMIGQIIASLSLADS